MSCSWKTFFKKRIERETKLLWRLTTSYDVMLQEALQKMVSMLVYSFPWKILVNVHVLGKRGIF